MVMKDEQREARIRAGTAKPLHLDIATVVAHGGSLDAQVLTEGLSEKEAAKEDEASGVGWKWKVEREAKFPLEILEQGYSVDVFHAQASVEVDRTRILNAIANKP